MTSHSMFRNGLRSPAYFYYFGGIASRNSLVSNKISNYFRGTFEMALICVFCDVDYVSTWLEEFTQSRQ